MTTRRPDVEDPRHALVFGEALRALREQQEAMREARGHAAQLLAVASVTTSFLGGLVLVDGGRAPRWATASAAVAGAAFLAMVAICVWVMLPRIEWSLTFSASALLDEYVEGDQPAPLGVMYTELALSADTHWQKTQYQVAARLRALRVAAGLLAVVTTTWCAALIGG